MNYEQLISKINSDTREIVKGYSISFLQEEFCYVSNSEEKFNKMINSDIALFEKIEKNSLEISEAKLGDFVRFDNDKIARISVIHSNGKIQLSNQIGVYMSSDGFASASGCSWDSSINTDESKWLLDNLQATKELKKAKCWTFSQGYSGADRGVYHHINFKVWEIK